MSGSLTIVIGIRSLHAAVQKPLYKALQIYRVKYIEYSYMHNIVENFLTSSDRQLSSLPAQHVQFFLYRLHVYRHFPQTHQWGWASCAGPLALDCSSQMSRNSPGCLSANLRISLAWPVHPYFQPWPFGKVKIGKKLKIFQLLVKKKKMFRQHIKC